MGGNVTVELGCAGRVVACLTEVGSLLSRGMSCVGEDLEGVLVPEFYLELQ